MYVITRGCVSHYLIKFFSMIYLYLVHNFLQLFFKDCWILKIVFVNIFFLNMSSSYCQCFPIPNHTIFSFSLFCVFMIYIISFLRCIFSFSLFCAFHKLLYYFFLKIAGYGFPISSRYWNSMLNSIYRRIISLFMVSYRLASWHFWSFTLSIVSHPPSLLVFVQTLFLVSLHCRHYFSIWTSLFCISTFPPSRFFVRLHCLSCFLQSHL